MKQIISRLPIGKLRVLDWIIIIVVGVILSAFVVNRLMKKTEWVDVRLKVSSDEWWWQSQPPPYWYVDDLVVGMVAYNSFRQPVAEITDIFSVDDGGPQRRTFIDMKILTQVDERRGMYYYNFQPLQIGKSLDLTFGKQNVRGLVTYIASDMLDYQAMEIELKLLNQHTWVADSYSPGMKMVDTQGRVIAEILDVQTELAKTFEFFDAAGRRVISPDIDEDRRDVTMRVKVLTWESQGVNIFINGTAIKIGEYLWLQFPQTAIRSAQISKIISD